MSFTFERIYWQTYLNEVYSYLHHHPETSWQEQATTSFLQRQLSQLGYQTTTFPDCTGVVGEYGNGVVTVALRADMDALGYREGEATKAIHACGHDAHMAMVLTAAAALKQNPANCRIKIIFQPAEEVGAGALKLIEKGVVDEVDYLFGVHLRPVQELAGGLAAPAIQNGAACILQGEIRGRSAHGARPQLGINVIEVAAQLVQMLQGLHWNPLQPASIKMTRLWAGNASANIIPDRADFSLDVRAQTNQQMQELKVKINHLAVSLATAYGATITLQPGADTPAAEISDAAQEILAQAIRDTLGEKGLAPPVLTPGAEDFHYYTCRRPQVKATMLGLGCNLQPGLHHPEMTFEEKYLIDGAEILARALYYAATNSYIGRYSLCQKNC
ncbi:M20 peptidase aminoacylase family protein [Desulforamulus aeronauticus]|uniref:Amidohydrolase n=1 Tax=Desulforamulus aeronauticus DSM 10349 TaxID=1121421 RepID=A0A1M6WJR0_9FIRM|nr:M20 peptidase aminoacylase family protein [Desulforamulus aeronauticus]SHK93844.1 amidohydrolase [Desulforamulus aeronauticus DSM 10349]